MTSTVRAYMFALASIENPESCATLLYFYDRYIQDQDSLLRLTLKQALVACEEEGLDYGDIVSSLLEFFPGLSTFCANKPLIDDITFQEINLYLGDTFLAGLLDGIGDSTVDVSLLKTAGGLKNWEKDGLKGLGIAGSIIGGVGLAAALKKRLDRGLAAERARVDRTFVDDFNSQIADDIPGIRGSIGSLERSFKADAARYEDRVVDNLERDPEKDLYEAGMDFKEGNLRNTVIETSKSDLDPVLKSAARQSERLGKDLIERSFGKALVDAVEEVPTNINTITDKAYSDFKSELGKFKAGMDIEKIASERLGEDSDLLPACQSFLDKKLMKYCADQDLLTQLTYKVANQANLGELTDDLTTTLDSNILNEATQSYGEMINSLVDGRIQALERAGVKDAKETLSNLYDDMPLEEIATDVSKELKSHLFKLTVETVQEGLGDIKKCRRRHR